MHLSRIALNKERRDTVRALGVPQRMHAAVLSSFPPKLEDDELLESLGARTLWRVDETKNATWLYVLSDQRPDFHHIVDQFGWPDSDQTWETKDYQQLLNRLEKGQVWRFRLQANPVKTTDGKILPHITIDHQKDWLANRAEKNGFSFVQTSEAEESINAFDVVSRDTIVFKKNPTSKTKITLSVAVFEGALIVHDVAALKKALCFGIGRAKAYGCGLLTLARY